MSFEVRSSNFKRRVDTSKLNIRNYKVIRISLSKYPDFKEKALFWAKRYNVWTYLDGNGYRNDAWSQCEGLLAMGVKEELELESSGNSNENAFDLLSKWHQTHLNWCFGFLSYDLKNDTELLTSENTDRVGFPELYFFIPKLVIRFFNGYAEIHGKNKTSIADEIAQLNVPKSISPINSIELTARISKQQYLETITAIKNHILEGDIYELNFCQEFFAENVSINPFDLFQSLNSASKAPFSLFYKCKDKYLMSFSPERFLQKRGRQLISQPIKGTLKRGSNKSEDDALKVQLQNSEKDRAENVMIVDLVRNDLARTCETGSVKVEELFEVYSFEGVHHLVSTVTGQLKEIYDFADALKAAFPMGSMTGAPKVKSMELIELYEQTKRGVYSGAAGYITPEGDFDFNVVIRSLLYNAKSKYLSCQVGGAIVYDSDPEGEYEECLLKVSKIRNGLKGS